MELLDKHKERKSEGNENLEYSKLTYFWSKEAGRLMETACLKCNSWASQKGNSTLAPCSTCKQGTVNQLNPREAAAQSIDWIDRGRLPGELIGFEFPESYVE